MALIPGGDWFDGIVCPLDASLLLLLPFSFCFEFSFNLACMVSLPASISSAFVCCLHMI